MNLLMMNKMNHIGNDWPTSSFGYWKVVKVSQPDATTFAYCRMLIKSDPQNVRTCLRIFTDHTIL